MSQNNNEFLDLLKSSLATETFNVTLTDNNEYSFKQLNTNHLKDLIKSVVDSPVTQAIFSKTLSKIMKETLVTENCDVNKLNVVDRLLFCLETRIKSIQPSFTIVNEEEKINIDLNEYVQKLKTALNDNKQLFATQTLIDVNNPNIIITYGVPLLLAEEQLVDEIYTKNNYNIENQEDLRKVVGEAFVNEIAKTIQTITINGQVLDFSTVNFKTRLKTVESLPASKINSIVEYIENYKKVIDSSLAVKEGVNIPIDGSLFSLR